MKYKIVALIGEAGSGKDSTMQKVIELNNIFNIVRLNEIISYTTRPIRDNEVDGINYHYVSKEEFEELIELNQMLEYTFFNGWYYGTGYGSLDLKKINIGVFNPSGIYSLTNKNNIDLKIYRILSTDKDRLLRQLNREKEPKVDEIIRRYSTDAEDFKNLGFKYTELVNFNRDNLYFNAAYILNGTRDDI